MEPAQDQVHTSTDAGAPGSSIAPENDTGLDSRPALPGFDPLSPEQVRDPHPVLERARRERPVFFSAQQGVWCVTRFEDVKRIYGDPIAFSNSKTHGSRVTIPEAIQVELGSDVEEYEFAIAKGALNDTDPPVHTRVRKVLQPHFTASRVKGYEPMIQLYADELVDCLVDGGECDMLQEFSAPLAARVIATLLGVSRTDAAQFKAWADARFHLMGGSDALDHEETLAAWRGAIEFDRYVEKLVADRRRTPHDDLTSNIVHAEGADGRPALSDDEAYANVSGMVSAGSDTTAGLITHAVYLLLIDPPRWEAIKRDPSGIPRAVEETMRMMGPVRGVFRRTTKAVELGGVTIPEGEEIYIHLASAGRDDQVFRCPHVFDAARANASDHLGFGIWTHFCVGAVLARAEARIALETFVRRLPDLRLLSTPEELEFTPSQLVCSLKGLRVAW
ncbi:MAG: cytochrome P450 [Solirubrobacterales bacterium]